MSRLSAILRRSAMQEAIAREIAKRQQLSLRSQVAISVAVALAYFGAAKLGFLLVSGTKQVSAVWPPTGIAIVALLLFRSWIAPAVYLAAFAVNWSQNEPLGTALGIAFGNTLGPLLGAELLHRVAHIDPALSRVRDVLSLVGFGALGGMAVTATNGVICLALSGIVPWSAYFSVWWLWWVGDAMGVLIIAPLLLTTAAQPRLQWRGVRLLEFIVLFATLVVIVRVLFFAAIPLTWGVFPFAVWAALRFGPRETSLAMLIIAAAALWGVVHDRGPFSVGPRELRLIILVLFMGVMAITALVLAAASNERFQAEKALHQAHDELERRVEERTAELASANANLKQVNRELARGSEALQAKSAEVESFVYVVSHDLRAPLVNLQGFSEELRASCRELDSQLGVLDLPPANKQTIERITSEGIHDALRYISASTTKLQQLIDALLVLSRTGREQYTMQPLEIAQLARASVTELRKTIDECGAQVQVAELPQAFGDATAIGQVFANLIGNAIKYLKPGRPGEIEVGGEAGDDVSHYWVRDNGSGFGANAMKRLFQVFARFHPQLASGEGMGLAIVKRVVERHGGRIWAESTEGVGTTFHFTLPSLQRKRNSWLKTA